MKTLALRRVDDYFTDSINRARLIKIASMRLDSHKAEDVVSDTYLQCYEREVRGQGFDEDYGSTFDTYINGILNGVMFSYMKGSEITMTDLKSQRQAAESESFDLGGEQAIKSASARETTSYKGYAEDTYFDNYFGDEETIEETIEKTTGDFVSICDVCRIEVSLVLNAVKSADDMNVKLTKYMFEPLAKRAKKTPGVVHACRDFITQQPP